MFKKILIANRGEIAVRIIRTCRDMGISTVALYEAADRGSLHVRLADECVLLEAGHGYLDTAAILKIAQATGAEAIVSSCPFCQSSFQKAAESCKNKFGYHDLCELVVRAL